MRQGVYDRHGEPIAYLDGDRLLDLNGEQIGYRREGAIYNLSGEKLWRVEGDGLYIGQDNIGYLGGATQDE